MIPPYFSDAQMRDLAFNPEYTENGDVCPVCLGRGHYFYQDQRHECPDDDYGHPMLRLAKLYWLSFIPLQYQQLLWSEFPHKGVQEDIDMYLERYERMIRTGAAMTFYGKQLGVGKTWAATHILKELVKRGCSGHFANFLWVKNYWERDNKQEREFLINRVLKSRVLVLDEVVAPRSDAQRDFFESQLESYLRERTNMNFPTFVTSNMTPNDFEREYPRVYSLLAAKNQEVELQGIDARKNGKVFENILRLALKDEVRPIE